MEVSSAVPVGFNKKQEVYASSSKKRQQQTTYLLFFFFFFCWLPVWLFTFHWKENLMPERVLLFSQVFAKENKHLQFFQPENHFTVTRHKWQAACRRNFLRIYRESSSIISMPLMCWVSQVGISVQLKKLADLEKLAIGSEFQYVPLPMAPPPSNVAPATTPSLGNLNSQIFEELPVAEVVEVSQSKRNDMSLASQLVYTIECKYRQFTWQLKRRAAEVLLLHLALKKRALLEELQEKQELLKEWMHSLGLGDEQLGINVALQLQVSDEEGTDEISQFSSKTDIPARAVLPVMRPAFGWLPTISQRATSAMQNYLNYFLASIELVNTREVCCFLEVSKLSFTPEYGPKLREGYLMVCHLSRIPSDDDESPSCCSSFWTSCWCWLSPNWQRVWVVLKPGFLALLADPMNVKVLDTIMFDVLPPMPGRDAAADIIGSRSLATVAKEKNPLRFSFTVQCGNRAVRMWTSWAAGARNWVMAINDAALEPSAEGWCYPHRFQSFAPERGHTHDGSEAQWFIDGKAAFDAMAMAIEHAETEIFITGWWLSPELYLRRPFKENEASRLDHLLEAKAKMGIKIYILLYKEVSMALKINSNYSKQRLLALHENIKVLRWPNHFSSGVYLWSHHEKLVIVDNYVCFLGGLDMCFGRYDDPTHPVCDSPSTIWPGRDYYNPRESEPDSWEEPMKDELDRNKLPRMPWHDVQCAIWGPPCRDIARHFVQRWNYAKQSKAPNQQTIPLLLPHQHMVIPHYRTGQEEAKSKMNSIQQQASQKIELASSYDDIPSRGMRNTFDGVLKDFVGISALQGSGRRVIPYDPIPRKLSSAMIETSIKQIHSVEEIEKQKPPKEEFLRDEEPTQVTTKVQQCFDSDGVRDQQILETGPRSQCKIQVIRSVSHWSASTSQPEERSIEAAYCELIEKAEYFIYIENQFFISGLDGDETIQNRVSQALYARIVRAYNKGLVFRVIVVIPLLPAFPGGLDEVGAGSVRFIMHWQYRTICHGKHSLLEKLKETLGSQRVEDYISFYGLRNHGQLHKDGPWATSLVYVHSKLMIVDDRFVLTGSANINDRSLLGSRDSEIGVVLEDLEQMESRMDGKPWSVGPFAHSLRISLWGEHLGLQHSELDCIKDPICDTTFKDIWMSRARNNTRIYEMVFECIPTDTIHSKLALQQAMAHRKQKVGGQTTIDLGIAPQVSNEKVNTNSDGGHEAQLHAVHGHLVNFPLNFMVEEDLRPDFKETEFYTCPQIYS